MFDVGFAELVLILIIGLLVLGPERLPGAIRTTGLWIARLRRSFNELRSEIERDARIDEIKRDLHNQSILDSLKGTADDLEKLRHLPYDVSDVVRRSRPPSAAADLPPPHPAAGPLPEGTLSEAPASSTAPPSVAPASTEAPPTSDAGVRRPATDGAAGAANNDAAPALNEPQDAESVRREPPR